MCAENEFAYKERELTGDERELAIYMRHIPREDRLRAAQLMDEIAADHGRANRNKYQGFPRYRFMAIVTGNEWWEDYAEETLAEKNERLERKSNPTSGGNIHAYS